MDKIQNTFTAYVLRSVEGTRKKFTKEKLLESENQGIYQNWDDLSDRNLVAAIQLLKQGEREMLFQRIFEEKSFEEISRETGEARNRVENRYYYTVKKIRRWMGVKNHEF